MQIVALDDSPLKQEKPETDDEVGFIILHDITIWSSSACMVKNIHDVLSKKFFHRSDFIASF